MGIFKMLDDLASSLADKIRHGKINGPEFLNEDSTQNKIDILNDLLNQVGDDQKELVEKELKLTEIGLNGEQNVLYELKNSKEDILVLHDITLENNYKDSQIDFIIIAKSCIIILETKKLSGDIEINSDGDFIRYYKNAQGKVYKKEGIYSHITQNTYHVNTVKDLLVKNKMIKNFPIYSLIVIANPKTVINKTYAKKEVKNMIVKYDQLNERLNTLIKPDQNNEFDFTDNKMYEIANLLISHNQPREYDYVEKLHLNLVKNKPQDVQIIDENDGDVDINDDILYEKLKEYRFKRYKELKLYKPYYLFNDETLSELVLKKPKTKDELFAVKGFGETRYAQCGEDIITIIKNDDVLLDEKSQTNNDELIKKLKSYRMKKSIDENVKPYLIFNNAEMEDLILKMPKTKEELLNVKGFGTVKVDKYGDELIYILDSFR